MVIITRAVTKSDFIVLYPSQRFERNQYFVHRHTDGQADSSIPEKTFVL